MPICLLVLALSRRYVPETRRETPSRIDWQGTLYLALILCCLLFPMALGPELHWPLWLQLMLVAVLPLLFAMRQSALRQQQRGDHPLLPPRLLQLTSIRFGMVSPCCFQRTVRLYVLHGADHAGGAGDGAVAVRQ